MGVLSDLKSRLGRFGADGQNGNEEADYDQAEDIRADASGADDFRYDVRTGADAVRGNRALADLPAIPLGADGEEEDVPLVSRSDVKRYLRDLEARALDPDYRSEPRGARDAAPVNAAQTFAVPTAPVSPAPAYVPPSAPAGYPEGTVPPAQEARAAETAPAQATAHPGYAQSAFMGPRAGDVRQPQAAADAWQLQAAAAVAPAASAYAYAAPEAPANGSRSFRDASADFLPKDAAPSPLFASDAVTHLPSTSIRELVVVNPGSFEDAEMISAALRARKLVVITVREVPEFLSRRILDFAFGAASVSGATVAVIANKIYALTFDAPLNQYEILSLRDKGVL